MSGAWTSAVACMYASKINTIRAESSYYFGSPVELPNYHQDIRITGPAMAGWIKTTVLQGQITGAPGMEALFKFTAQGGTVYYPGPFNYGAGALEIDHIRFDGGSSTTGVVSALLSSAAGGPARPVHVHNCEFLRFSKAISSDIGAGVTGLTAISISHNTFYLNQHAVYGNGNGALQNLSFTNNVSEMGGRIAGTNMAFSGSLTITDNLLEGQSDTIDIAAGTVQALIARNYFEANTGKIVHFAASASGYLELGPNYYSNTVNGTIAVTNVELTMKDTALPATVTTVYSRLSRKSKTAPLTYLANTTTGFINSLDPALFPTLFDNQATISTGRNWRVGTSLANTPAGMRTTKALTAPAVSFQYTLSQAMTAGDYVVATMLVKNQSANTIKALLYSSAGAYITESAAIGLNRAGEYTLVHVAIRTSVTDTSVKLAWQTDTGTVFLTDFYLYSLASPTTSTPFYVYIPPLAVNGTATLPASATNVTVTTGLDTAAVLLTATPTSNLGTWWIDNITSTTFRLNVSAATGVDRTFFWQVN